MNRLLDNKNSIRNLLYFLMVFSLVYVIGKVIFLDLSLVNQIILTFIITMSVKFIINNTLIFYLSIIFIIIGGLVANNYIMEIYPYFERAVMLFNNIYDHLFREVLILEENIFPFWIFLTLIYSIFTSIIIFRPKKELFSILVIYLPLFIYYWYIHVDEAYFALAVFLFSYFILYGLSKYRKEKSKVDVELRKQFSILTSSWNRTTVIYSILIVIIALMLPKNNGSMNWIWMEDQVASIIPKIENMRSNNSQSRDSGQAGIFNFNTTGFQEDPSRLGGPISPNNRLVMKVRADEPTYLRGTVRHHYDGNIWHGLETHITEHPLESNFSYINAYESREYYDEKDIIIQFVDYASTTLFSPYMPTVINAENGEQIALTEDHILEIPEGIYAGESYGVKVLQARSYYELVDSGINNRYGDIQNIENYLQVPMDKLTQRTMDLKDEVLSGIHSDYEKAVALESYFRNNYEYTLNTSPIPEGHEFIDYFLFEEQAGYCTYYATAMSIFLRLEGIPSRYVEGYIAYETSDDEVFEVRESHAHAWVEAYIEPVGWITFEPTSVYPRENRAPNYESDDEDVIPEVEEESAAEENMENEQELDADDTIKFNGDSEIENSTEKDTVSPKNIFLIILGLICLIIIMTFLIKFLMYRIHEYKIRKLSKDKKMMILYQKILELIEKLGYPKKYGETHYEYTDRIGYKFIELREITNIFVRNKYGNTTPTTDEIQKLLDYRKDLEGQLKNYLGIVKYYIHKY